MMVAAKTSSLLVAAFLLGFVHVNCQSESNESNLGSNESDLGSNESDLGSNEKKLDDAPKTRISGGTNTNKLYSFVPRIISSFTSATGIDTIKGCNGAYIKFGFILTTARCVRQDPGTISPNRINIYFEKVVRDKNLDGSTNKLTLEFNPTNTSVHPGFEYGTRRDDLAIIRVDKNILINFVQPIIIRERRKHEVLNSLYVAGWGKINASDSAGATRLQFGKVSTIPDNECRASNPANITLENKICTRGPARLCVDDEGSPLVSTKRNNKPSHLIGIASYSSECVDGAKPDVFVDVSKYYDWIKTESKRWR